MERLFMWLHEKSGRPGQWGDDLVEVREVPPWAWAVFLALVAGFVWFARVLAAVAAS